MVRDLNRVAALARKRSPNLQVSACRATWRRINEAFMSESFVRAVNARAADAGRPRPRARHAAVRNL